MLEFFIKYIKQILITCFIIYEIMKKALAENEAADSALLEEAIAGPQEAEEVVETVSSFFMDILPFMPELFLLLSVILLLIFISAFSKYNQNVEFARFVAFLAMMCLIGSLKALFIVLGAGLDSSYLNGHFFINDFVIWIKVALIVASLFFFLSFYDNIKIAGYINIELSLISLISIIGMFILVSANDLFILYLGVELQSLALFIMCAIKKHSNLSIEAGLKYFILGSFSSAILISGVSLVFGFFGTVSYTELAICFNPDSFDRNPVGAYFGLGCVLVGLLFKLGVAPFHMWMADIFEGSPYIITYFFAVVPKISILFAFYRLFIVSLPTCLALFSPFITLCAILSVVIGTVFALYQTKIKRFLAYSAIVHMGYILLGLCLGANAGAHVAFYYLLVYVLSSINIFTIYLVAVRQSNSGLVNIVDGISLLQSNKWLAYFFAMALFSLAGVPPLPGFFGKLYVFNLLIATENYFLAFFLVLMSVVSCVYYLRLIRFTLFTEEVGKPPIVPLKKIPDLQGYLISFLFVVNVFFMFYHAPILFFLEELIFKSVC